MSEPDIYFVLRLQPDGFPFCPTYSDGDSREAAIVKQLTHLRVNLNDASANEITQMILPQGSLDQGKLLDLLSAGDVNAGSLCASCAGKKLFTPTRSGESANLSRETTPTFESKKRNKRRRVDDQYLWILDDHSQRAFGLADCDKRKENMVKKLNRLRRFPYEIVLPCVQKVKTKRQNSRRSGVKKGPTLTQSDCDQALHMLKSEERMLPTSSSPGLEGSIWTEYPNQLGDDTVASQSFPPRPTSPLRANQRPASADHITIESDDGSGHLEDTRPRLQLADEDLSSLKGNGWVDDRVMHAFLKILETLLDPTLTRLVDPICVPAGTTGNFAASATILVPLHVNNNHWVVAQIERGRDEVDVYDSRPQSLHREEARRKIIAFMKANGMEEECPPDFSFTAPVLQKNDFDCGVAAMMILLYLALNIPVDHRIDLSCSRKVLYEMLQDPHAVRNRGPREFLVTEQVHWFTRRQSVSAAEWGRMVECMVEWGKAMLTNLEEERSELAKTKVSNRTAEALGILQRAKELARGRRSEYMEEVLLRLDHAEESLKRELDIVKQKEEIERALALTKAWLGRAW